MSVALVALNAPGYQSLALGYLRAFAQADTRLAGRAGFVTLDLDAGIDPWWVAYRTIVLKPDVVAFSVMCWNAESVYTAASIIGKALPDAVIVLGGPEVSPIAKEVLGANPAVSAVVRAEGEETFAELLVALQRGRPLHRVEGVTARDGDRVVSAPDRPLIGSLDTVPSPYLSRALSPAEDVAYLETFRGCPHRCGYCFEGKGYGRVRSFSRERVAAEIEYLVNDCNIRTFSFVDPVFNLTPERLDWLTGLLEPYAAAGVRLHTIEVDIERVGPADAARLARAGVRSVETGPQTVGEQALGICRRGFDEARFAAGVRALKDAGISVECDLIIGLPGDTAADVLAGLRFVLGLDPGKIQCSTLAVLPGTDLWRRADELGIVYNENPPHEVIATGTIGFQELRRLEVYGSAVAAHYRARVLPSENLPGHEERE
jgi:radical SAM superfamily enzyme YgiQ (UPF0313 family)